MTAVFELSETDIAPELGSASSDVAPGICAKPGCVNGITKPARGRAPKYCDEHKGQRGNSSKSESTGKSWARAVEVESLLTSYVDGIGLAVSFLDEFDGKVIRTKAPAVVHELVELAKSDKTLQKYLLWMATPGRYAPLTMAVMSVAIPIMANHDLLPKFSIPAPDMKGGEE